MQQLKEDDEKMNNKVIIDEEFRTLLPPLSEEEYEKLSNMCCKYGIRDPLKIWNGILIDGHNRYQISEEHDLNYEVEDMTDDFKDRAEVMQWIIDNQSARRNLTLSQKIQAQAKVHAELEKEAKERQRASGGDRRSSEAMTGSGKFTTTDSGRVSEQMAQKVGMSEKTYRDAKYVVENGTAEQIKRMDKGGKGNGVSAIAKEIKRDKSTTIKCKKCGVEYPSDYFSGNRNVCKYCRDIQKHSTLHDVKGNVIKSTGEFSSVLDDEVIGNLYDIDKEVKNTTEDVIDEFMENVKAAILNLRRILESYRGVIKDNREDLKKMWDDAEDLFKELKEEFE